MRRLTTPAANLLWAGASIRARQRFRTALENPMGAQRERLACYVRDNCDTDVGRAHGFSRILDAYETGSDDFIKAYQERVPLTSYDEIEPRIARVAAGEPGVLTTARIERLTPSSGSTSAAKLIPQTRELQREFSRAVDAWIADLFVRRPDLVRGPAYWSITPSLSFESVVAARLRSSASRLAIPVGFDEDSAYLGGLRQKLVRAILAVPSEVRKIADPEAFRYVTLLFLIRAKRLRLISVWHPSYLLHLFDALQLHADRLVHDIARGTIDPPGQIPADVRVTLARKTRADSARSVELKRMRTGDPQEIWPGLAAVSCWSDGAARPYAEQLSRALPRVEIQPKGLIATEAVVSIPFADRHPIAVRSHFFEFLDGDGRPRLVRELETGAEYTVVVTTGGGLYRYRLGDRVRVDGWVGETPSIAFAGRADRVSDRFGEKLSDGFVTRVLAAVLSRSEPPSFAMLAPEITSEGVAYTLLIEPTGSLPGGLAESLERALRENPHYAWCVDLGQLRPARVVCVGPHADRRFLEACVGKGQRLGDVKPVALHHDTGWERTLGMASR